MIVLNCYRTLYCRKAENLDWETWRTDKIVWFFNTNVLWLPWVLMQLHNELFTVVHNYCTQTFNLVPKTARDVIFRCNLKIPLILPIKFLATERKYSLIPTSWILRCIFQAIVFHKDLKISCNLCFEIAYIL